SNRRASHTGACIRSGCRPARPGPSARRRCRSAVRSAALPAGNALLSVTALFTIAEGRMQSQIDLTHHFLIAMPNMVDPHFAKTLTFICEHNDKGALGVVVNRPIEMSLQTLLEQ